MDDYSSRVSQQIEQYANTVNMHDLPQSFHLWSHNFILPALQSVYAVDSINDFFVNAVMESYSTCSKRILSIGCGDGLVEIGVAESLLNKGVRDFKIVATDLSPILLDRCRTELAARRLNSFFDVVECDLNNLGSVSAVAGPYDTIMANHSLHHIVELEKLFDFSLASLTPSGVFAANDMIGRNGHMRWPEAAAVVKAFWPLLSPIQRYHVQLQRLDDQFTDHDCSTEGFEGIRAQDILPLLLERFHASKFVGVGGFVDTFVDRSFGHGFNPEDEHDRDLIMCIATLNDILLDAGTIKPTIMLAHFTKEKREERFYRTRSARNSVRITGA